MEVKRKYPAHSKRPAAPGVATLLPFNSSAATAHPSPTPRRLSRRLDRKSTRLNSKSLRHLVCRLLLEKKKVDVLLRLGFSLKMMQLHFIHSEPSLLLLELRDLLLAFCNLALADFTIDVQSRLVTCYM